MNAMTLLAFGMVAVGAAEPDGSELFPPASLISTEHPRLLLRKEASPFAVSLGDLRGGNWDADARSMLQQLRGQNDAAAQAMVWLLTGEDAAAEKAIQRMLDYRYPGGVDTFHVYLRLSEFALAYDWLYGHPRFTDEVRAAVRANVAPLVQAGLKYSDDHVFHNYIWMSAGGCAWWSLATVGEDEQANGFYETIAERFNRRLFPAMRYLDGLPSEPMGYWSLYDLTPAIMTVIGLQSASGSDCVAMVARRQGDWLSRHFENLVHCVLPNMRYIPWGDLQSGPNGGVTYEMAGTIDAATWALQSPHGAWLSRRLAKNRGLRRFYGSTA
ncbi:MAG: hypothetical protein JJ992_00360, partial [Planctomycetes bacterium]|nr:hypothetical protein [Planctomycetota bacterium]